MASSSNSPCAACKFLRRKCTKDCVFAPYFPPDQPQKFAHVHKVFGASNVTKLLNNLNPEQRADAVNSLAYEAEERLKDPVYGCVGLISVLQKRLKQVQTDLYVAKKELATYLGPTAHMPVVQPTSANAGNSSYDMMMQQCLLQGQFSISPTGGFPTRLAAGPFHAGASGSGGGGQLVIKEAQEQIASLAVNDDEDSIRNWEQQQQQQLSLNGGGGGTMDVGGINQVGSASGEASTSLAHEVVTFDQSAYNQIQSQQLQKQDEALKQLLVHQATWHPQ